jgi:Zn-dependent peptidase ImmA (M78 family)
MTQTADVFAARLAAAKIIESLAITRPEDIVIEDIAMIRGVLVLEDRLDGAEARLVRKGNQAVIRVRKDIPEIGRKRFGIAHELGHWERHKGFTQLALCTESDMQDYSCSHLEIEANAFASHLLMPTQLSYPRCKEATPALEVLMELADEFNTTLTATAVRFVEECQEMCMVIFSEDGRVKWWKKNDRLKGIWLESEQAIHNNSLAWDCLNGKPTTIKMQPVQTRAWLQQECYSPKFQLYEQSMRLGH